ncbi:MAG: hypothetical protein M5R36_18065 [Deltaproteobacteria bacterium]|nr:hypothetical protein [Deltaproteobacteria bacterium]
MKLREHGVLQGVRRVKTVVIDECALIVREEQMRMKRDERSPKNKRRGRSPA